MGQYRFGRIGRTCISKPQGGIGQKTAELSGGSGQSFIARGTAGKNREQAMTYMLRFLPLIEEDALAGYTWYEEKARGLGGEFLRLFYAGAREIPAESTAVPELEQGSI